MDQVKGTVMYAGDLQDARQVDGKIWFAVDGEAILTREMSSTGHRQESGASGPNVTASVHVVPRFPSTSTTSISPMASDRPQPEHNPLLIKAAQANPTFAPATCLPPGVHIMCHVEPPSKDENSAHATATSPKSNTWSALWDDLRAGAGAREEAERLKWQRRCLELMNQVAVSLDSEAIAGVVQRSAPAKGWALVPCEPKSGLVCLLASGRTGVGGKVGWFHVGSEEAEDGDVAVADSLLFTSAVKPEPAYASARAHVDESGNINVVTEAHRVLSGGSLSGYDLSSTRPRNGIERTDSEVEQRTDEGTEVAGKRVDDAVFVDDALSPRVDGRGWRGTVLMEELPGGGLHRHVRVKIDIRCNGLTCDEDLDQSNADNNSNNEWCELLLSQHVPQGAYIDVDEVKARHDFDMVSSLPTRPRVGVDTFGGVPIDIELPASVSGQHLVNFSVWIGLPAGRRGGASITAELTLPVHLRYPDPGCERRAEECEEYAWVEVAPPLASIRCGSAGKAGSFSPVLPSSPPQGVALPVPRGLAWHRDLVVWGTIGAAALGTLYTVYTLFSVIAADSTRNPRRKNRSKAHVE